jgi:hypothetical protein
LPDDGGEFAFADMRPAVTCIEHHQNHRQSPLISEDDLAVRWKVSKRTLQRWRNESRLPKAFKVGRKILYRLDAVEAFESAQVGDGEGA